MEKLMIALCALAITVNVAAYILNMIAGDFVRCMIATACVAVNVGLLMYYYEEYRGRI